MNYNSLVNPDSGGCLQDSDAIWQSASAEGAIPGDTTPAGVKPHREKKMKPGKVITTPLSHSSLSVVIETQCFPTLYFTGKQKHTFSNGTSDECLDSSGSYEEARPGRHGRHKTAARQEAKTFRRSAEGGKRYRLSARQLATLRAKTLESIEKNPGPARRRLRSRPSSLSPEPAEPVEAPAGPREPVRLDRPAPGEGGTPELPRGGVMGDYSPVELAAHYMVPMAQVMRWYRDAYREVLDAAYRAGRPVALERDSFRGPGEAPADVVTATTRLSAAGIVRQDIGAGPGPFRCTVTIVHGKAEAARTYSATSAHEWRSKALARAEACLTVLNQLQADGIPVPLDLTRYGIEPNPGPPGDECERALECPESVHVHRKAEGAPRNGGNKSGGGAAFTAGRRRIAEKKKESLPVTARYDFVPAGVRDCERCQSGETHSHLPNYGAFIFLEKRRLRDAVREAQLDDEERDLGNKDAEDAIAADQALGLADFIEGRDESYGGVADPVVPAGKKWVARRPEVKASAAGQPPAERKEALVAPPNPPAADQAAPLPHRSNKKGGQEKERKGKPSDTPKLRPRPDRPGHNEKPRLAVAPPPAGERLRDLEEPRAEEAAVAAPADGRVGRVPQPDEEKEEEEQEDGKVLFLIDRVRPEDVKQDMAALQAKLRQEREAFAPALVAEVVPVAPTLDAHLAHHVPPPVGPDRERADLVAEAGLALARDAVAIMPAHRGPAQPLAVRGGSFILPLLLMLIPATAAERWIDYNDRVLAQLDVEHEGVRNLLTALFAWCWLFTVAGALAAVVISVPSTSILAPFGRYVHRHYRHIMRNGEGERPECGCDGKPTGDIIVDAAVYQRGDDDRRGPWFLFFLGASAWFSWLLGQRLWIVLTTGCVVEVGYRLLELYAYNTLPRVTGVFNKSRPMFRDGIISRGSRQPAVTARSDRWAWDMFGFTCVDVGPIYPALFRAVAGDAAYSSLQAVRASGGVDYTTAKVMNMVEQHAAKAKSYGSADTRLRTAKLLVNQLQVRDLEMGRTAYTRDMPMPTFRRAPSCIIAPSTGGSFGWVLPLAQLISLSFTTILLIVYLGNNGGMVRKFGSLMYPLMQPFLTRAIAPFTVLVSRMMV